MLRRDVRRRAVARAAQGRSGGLTRETLIYGIGGGAAQIVNVSFLPIFTRIFSTSQFGALDFLLTLSSMATLFTQAGLNSALFFFYRRQDDVAAQRRVAATALSLTVAFGLVIATIGVFAAAPISNALLLTDDYAPAVALAFAWVPINVVGALALDLLRLEFRPVAYSLLGLGRTVLASVVGAVLAGPLGYGVAGLLAAYVVIGLAGAITTLWIARASWGLGFDRKTAGKMLRFGLPLVPTGIAYWVIAYSDRYFIIQILGISAAGIYGVASRVALGGQLVMYAFEAAWWPFAYARAREPGHRGEFARIFRVFTVGMIFLATLLGVFARELLLVLSTGAFVMAYQYVGVLALALVVHGAYGIISIGIQLSGRTKHMAWTSGLAALVNVALNILLIPRMGIVGAAVATLTAYLVSTSLLFVVAQRTYFIPYTLSAPAVAAIGGAALLAIGLVLDAQVVGTGWDIRITAAKVVLLGLSLAVTTWQLRLSPRAALGSLRGRPS